VVDTIDLYQPSWTSTLRLKYYWSIPGKRNKKGSSYVCSTS
jgi:hypothetical protein